MYAVLHHAGFFWCVDTEGSFHATNRLRQEVCARLHVKVEGLLFRRGAACSYCRSTYSSISFSSITLLPCHSTLSLSLSLSLSLGCLRAHAHAHTHTQCHLPTCISNIPIQLFFIFVVVTELHPYYYVISQTHWTEFQVHVIVSFTDVQFDIQSSETSHINVMSHYNIINCDAPC